MVKKSLRSDKKFDVQKLEHWPEKAEKCWRNANLAGNFGQRGKKRRELMHQTI